MRPLIITAAITGGGAPRARTPHQPVTPEQIVSEAVACWRAGAAIVHLHARRADGETTMDPAVYRTLCQSIRATGCDSILALSAGDDGGKADHGARLGVADAGGDMVSLAAGSFNLGDRLYDNRPGYIDKMAAALKGRHIKPELEIFDAGHLARIGLLEARGLIQAPYFLQLVAGPGGLLLPDTRLLELLVARMPRGAEWGVSAQTGDDHRLHAELLHWALFQGGHVRTGIEDMIWLRPGVLARSNAEMVEQWAATARTWGRPIASPRQARDMLGVRET